MYNPDLLSYCLRLTPEGEGYVFTSARSGDEAALKQSLGFIAELLRYFGVHPAAALPADASVHEVMVQLWNTVAEVANGSIKPQRKIEYFTEWSQKLKEYSDYLTEKCNEWKVTPPAKWAAGITLSNARKKDERVTHVLDLVKELLRHMYNAAKERGIVDLSAGPNDGPVRFISSEDDSRKQRNYFYYGNQTALVEMHKEFHLLVDLNDLSLTPTLIKTGWWEPWIDITLRSILRPGMTYVNAGANVGYHTNLAALMVESYGKVFSFEANPRVFDMLRRSLFINGFAPRTELYNAAVFDQNGEMEFQFAMSHLGGGGVVDAVPDQADAGPLNSHSPFDEKGLIDHRIVQDWQRVKVKSVTLDETVGAQVDTLDVLHMDIERSEAFAILGARDLIARSKDLKILFEWSVEGVQGEVEEKCHESLKFLIDQGFNFYVITPPNGKNVYTTPPLLKRVEPDELMKLGHCDLFATRA